MSHDVFNIKQIPETCEIVFVSDYFINEYVGGAELTSEALILSSNKKVFRLKSSEVSIELLQQGHKKFWIFGNWSQLNPQLIPTIIANINYAVLEYDYKYCRYRSPEKHFFEEGIPCNCSTIQNGKIVSAFYYASKAMFWMSQKQFEKYVTQFPFLSSRNNLILSSVLSGDTLKILCDLRKETNKNEKWIILGSSSWVKGFNTAKQYAEENNLQYEVVWNLPYEELLKKLSKSKGLIYLPDGSDTCPRLVIEAKILGCELVLNDNVQHKDETWFDTDNIDLIIEHLAKSPQIFWNEIDKVINYVPTISGYTTTYNCIAQEYPFEECITSMLEFCDEVCVVDGGSTDKTWEKLKKLSKNNSKLKIKQIKRDWKTGNFAIYDGQQKAEARKMCTCEFAWQQDSDEVVHEAHYDFVKTLAKSIPFTIDIVCLPVVEYWGNTTNLRIDSNLWKWRLTRNKSNITHGIPKQLRCHDESGELYAAPGTDGCDLIDSESYEPIQNIMSFWTQDLENLRRTVLQGDSQALKQFQEIYSNIISTLPSVFHYSWSNMARKITLYRDYWQNHWRKIYNQDTNDTAQNNMFFDCPWSEVTDDMISIRAKELSTCGGHIWHTKWNGKINPTIQISLQQPQIMQK